MWTRIWALLDRWLFGPASGRAGLLGQCRRLLRYPYAVVRDLARGEINLRAMSLVYTTLLSLIPLLAFSFAILKAFGGHHDLEPIVYEFFSPVGGAAATELTNRVVQFASHVSSGLVGSVGLALLAWTLVGTIRKVEDSFNFLWHVEQPRGFARRLAEYTSLLIAGPVLLVGFIGLSHAALSSAPLQEMARLPLGLQPLRLSAAELEELSLRLMYFVGRAHAAGSRLWSVSRLAAELALPGIAVAQMATSLERAGLLVVSERGGLLPARDIRNIRVQEILDVARRQGSGHVVPRQLPIPAVDRLLAGLDEARRHRCGELTLGELVDEATRPALQLAPRQSGVPK